MMTVMWTNTTVFFFPIKDVMAIHFQYHISENRSWARYPAHADGIFWQEWCIGHEQPVIQNQAFIVFKSKSFFVIFSVVLCFDFGLASKAMTLYFTRAGILTGLCQRETARNMSVFAGYWLEPKEAT